MRGSWWGVSRGAIAASAAKLRLQADADDLPTRVGDNEQAITDLNTALGLLTDRVTDLETAMTNHTHSYKDQYRTNADPLTEVDKTTGTKNN